MSSSPEHGVTPERGGMVLAETVLQRGAVGDSNEIGSAGVLGRTFSPPLGRSHDDIDVEIDAGADVQQQPLIEQGGELFVKREIPRSVDHSPERDGAAAGSSAAVAASAAQQQEASQQPPATAASAAGGGAAAEKGTRKKDKKVFKAEREREAAERAKFEEEQQSQAKEALKEKKSGLSAIVAEYRAKAAAEEEARRKAALPTVASASSASNALAGAAFTPRESSPAGREDVAEGGSPMYKLGSDGTYQQPPRDMQREGGKTKTRAGDSVSDEAPPVVTAPRTRAAPAVKKDQTFCNQMHSVWLQHVDRLYDFYAQHFLEFPTSTVSFVPDSRVRFPAEYAMHQLYTGTVSPLDKNYLCAHHCFVPSEIEEEDKEAGDDDEGAADQIGKYTDVANLLQPVLKVAHDGPVQRLRVSPFYPSLVACRGRKHNMSVYQLADYSTEDTDKPPTTTLRGPRQAGHGLAWNLEESHLLAASANDGMVYVYDVNANIQVTAAGDDDDNLRVGSSTGPLMGLVGHQDIAYDVSWHCMQVHSLMSCDAQGKVFFWDTRSASKEFSAEVHHGPAISCSFHPTGIYAFVTCGVDGMVRVWDWRKVNKPTYNLVGHRGPVLGVRWAPFNNTILMSHAKDSTVILWDLSKVDTERIPGVDDHMRPEMVFQHFGHTGPVRDAQWCEDPEDPWTVVSVDDFNTVQLWSPAPNTYNNIRPDDDDDD